MRPSYFYASPLLDPNHPRRKWPIYKLAKKLWYRRYVPSMFRNKPRPSPFSPYRPPFPLRRGLPLDHPYNRFDS